MLSNILLVANILVCIALIIVVLMQRSEGGALGMGGGPSGFMTARGAGDLLTRTTWILFGLFLALSLGLTLLGGGSRSVTEQMKIQAIDPSKLNQPPAASAPATPGAPGAPVVPGGAVPGGINPNSLNTAPANRPTIDMPSFGRPQTQGAPMQAPPQQRPMTRAPPPINIAPVTIAPMTTAPVAPIRGARAITRQTPQADSTAPTPAAPAPAPTVTAPPAGSAPATPAAPSGTP